jgi:hypothetical protein
VTLVVARQEADGPVTAPELEGVGFVLALMVRPLDLEDGVSCRNDVRREAAAERFPELEIPLRSTLRDQPGKAFLPGLSIYAGVGQRYASGRRCDSDGSRRRTSSSHARSTSAEMTVSSSGAWASTVPQGSTISDLP